VDYYDRFIFLSVYTAELLRNVTNIMVHIIFQRYDSTADAYKLGIKMDFIWKLVKTH